VNAFSRWRQRKAADAAETGSFRLVSSLLTRSARTFLSRFGTATSPLKLALLLSLVWTLPLHADQLEWFTDIEAAQAKARNENKVVMLNFTGSDWCPWCKKLKAEVFDQPEFAEFAKSRLVATEVDFPHNKPLAPAQRQVNEKLVQVLQIKGFPTVVLLDPSGRPMGETGYLPGGPGPFIQALQRIVAGRQASAAPTAPPDPPEPPRKPPVFVPIAPAAPLRYNQLALKAISGPKNHRMAMINNENFYAGDTAKVKLLDERIEIFCKEVREDSVLITANGKPMELKLSKASGNN